MSKYDAHRVWVDNFHNVRYEVVHESMVGETRPELAHIDIDSKVICRVQGGTSEIMILREDDQPTEISFEDTTELPEFTSIVDDCISSAYLPTVHRPIILFDGNTIDRAQLIAQTNLTPDSFVE